MIENSEKFDRAGRKTMSDRLQPPSSPNFVRSNHFSIELEWEHIRALDEERPEHRRFFDETGYPRPGSLVYLQQREIKGTQVWEKAYAGSAMRCKVIGLRLNTHYEYRIQYKINSNEPEYSDWSPIMQASTSLEPASADGLYKAIAIHTKDYLDKFLKNLGPNHRILEQFDKDGNLPLMHSCSKLDINKVELLVRAGAKIDNYNFAGKTALMVAAASGFYKGCALLIEQGAKVNATDRNKISVLHYAIEGKNYDAIGAIVRQLDQDREVEINRQVTKHEWTPIYKAVMLDCSKEIIELLIKYGADVNCVDKSTGTSALQMAIMRGNLTTVQLLVNQGAHLNVVTRLGRKDIRDMAAATLKEELINYIDTLCGPRKTSILPN